ncbi:hypothetical protein EVAR_8730_1 [Eumeta japonica]|uniref:Uncharacterized protein n=1 Tax=Eumeta variegata TaxID=151549 RepID=A0A4C1XKQ9_EUMVA|nr:hypothetical protein EVAR_8730_1 [Eumeta japonica]
MLTRAVSYPPLKIRSAPARPPPSARAPQRRCLGRKRFRRLTLLHLYPLFSFFFISSRGAEVLRPAAASAGHSVGSAQEKREKYPLT